MPNKTHLSFVSKPQNRDLRERMRGFHVLVADRDLLTAELIGRILFSFGFRKVDVTNNSDEAIEKMRNMTYDFIVTEWEMHPQNGIQLVKEIRAAKDHARLKRDVPILMLTGFTAEGNIQIARDAGISEFVAKPFTAESFSSRIIRMIDQPRAFINSIHYAGPCRRRRTDAVPDTERRHPHSRPEGEVTPARFSLLQHLGVTSAREIINDEAVKQAQATIVHAENEFLDWAQNGITELQACYESLSNNPRSAEAQSKLIEITYSIGAQARQFGYPLGMDIAERLVDYTTKHSPPQPGHLLVIGKHVEAIRVIFSDKLGRDKSNEVAQELIRSLDKLVTKLE